MFYTIAKWKEDKARREKMLEELQEELRRKHRLEILAEFREELRQWIREGGTLEGWLSEEEQNAKTNGSSP